MAALWRMDQRDRLSFFEGLLLLNAMYLVRFILFKYYSILCEIDVICNCCFIY